VTKAIVYYAPLARHDYAELAARWLHKIAYAKRLAIERAPPGTALATLAGIELLSLAAAALEYDSLPAAALVFPERGKPCWPGGLDFNISHTADLVACVAARDISVGIDVEAAGRVSLATVRRVASSAELALVGATALGATHLWTRKEAVVKAAGGTVFDAGKVRMSQAHAEFRGRLWYFAGPDMLADHALAIAAARPDLHVELRPAF
jgi:phosphopantetheinyl transferase